MRIAALAAFLAASVVALTAAGPGTGTAIISPSSPVAAGSSGKWSITYTAAEVHDNGTVRITIPAGWTSPQNSSAMSPGFVSVITDEPTGAPGLSIAGQNITIAVDTLNVGNTITVVYGDDTISALGRAAAATAVGSYSFLVASDPSGSSPSPVVTSPSINVIPTTPASLDIVPNDTTGVAAGSFIQMHIRVLDTFGNRAPVPSNRTISLFATHGSFYDPANHSTPITSAVIASGTNVKRVDYRPTLVAGSPHTLNVFTSSGSPSLGGSTFVSVVPGALSASQSGVGANTPVVADGSSQSTVVVTSRDAFGNVRAGDTVTIAATGSAIDIDPPLPTNPGGQTSGVVTDTVAETVNVSASINGTPLTSGTAPITFVAGPVSAGNSTVDAVAGSVTADGVSTKTITVTARDAHNNPIAGQTVVLSVLPTTGTTLTQPGGVTNALGQVTGALACTIVASRTVSATIGATPITDTAVVDFVAGPVASFNVIVDGDAVAGTVDPVTITARDALGHTVTNYTGTVNLTTTSTGTNTVEWALGSGQGIISNTPGTNNGTYTFSLLDTGQATIRITDDKVETITVTAAAGGPTGTSGNLVVAPNFADKIELISGSGQSATVHTPVASLPTVRVVDAFNNPVPGATVTFTAVQGAGFVDVTSGGAQDSTGVTGSDGRIDCDVWRLGDVAGLNRMRVRIASGTTTFVYFTATGTAGAGFALDIVPNSQPVTQGTSLVVTAALTDQYGNAKSGDVVTIAITDSPDGTLALNGADPNPTSTINAFTRSGTTDAAGHITVLYNAPGAAPLSDVVDASSGAVTQGNVVNSVYTTTASGATNLRITFVGPSTKPANQTYQFLVEAIDGNNNVDATNTSTVTLTPEVGGNLTFSLTDFGSTVTSVQLVAGARTVYGRGTIAGDWDITASTGGLGPNTKVVTITDTGVIDHYAVSTVASVVAGVVFDVTVEARDVFDNRVLGANNAVTLEAYDDINPVLAQSTLLDNSATLASGRVTVAETYTKAEAIRVHAIASLKEGLSAPPTNVTAAPLHRIAKISGDASGIIAGATQVLTAQVLDDFDNPVNGAVVSFTVLTGGGSPSQPTATTSPSGQASITLTTGNTVGSNTVKATILDENPPSLERVDYLVTTVPGPVASFTVTPASYSLIAGTGVALNVTGFDTHSNLVTNDSATPIQLTNTGVAQFGTATGTLAAGQFNTTVVDTVAQSFTITATRQGGGATGTSGLVTVSNSGAYRITKVSGDASGVTAGTARTLDVLVRDNHSNPVAGALVTFATTGVINDGTFIDAVGDPNDGITTTDGTGHANISFTTSLTAGANAVNAQILDGSPPGRERVSFTINTIAGGIAYYTVQMSGTTAVAGTTRNATITAYDINDNPVDDDVTQVTLSGDPGNGLVFGANPVTLTNGVATTTVRADLVQTYKVRAGLPGPTGLGPDVTVTPANPAGVITGTPVPATITANTMSTSTITSSVIVDAFGNQVTTGTLVNVSASNGGVIVGGSPKAVAANGRIVFDLRSSATPGTSTVTMTSQVGTATGTVNVTFAPPPAFVASNPPTPSIVAPGDNVSFSVQVQNTSTTDANLTTATTFTFTDGTRTYTANLAAPASIVGPGTQTLVFGAAIVNAAFTPAFYQPTVTLVGTDEFGAAINTPTLLPAQSVLLTSIQITAITAPAVVSRGQTPTVTVFVKNNGAQTTHISDIDLVFAPAGGLFTPATITAQDIAPTATAQFDIPVLVDPSCPVNTYTIDAVATGDVGGKTVTDNSLAPFSLPSWQIIAAANLSYVAGSMTPMSVSRGAAYQFRATIANGGSGVVSLNETQSYIRFTDGTRTYQASPTQPYAIAGNSQQQIVFVSQTVNAAFTLGAYAATFHLQGLESGAPFSQDVNSGADQIAVQTPANPTPGSVLPDQVSKGSSVSFTVQVNNTGTATVVLTPASTKFRFASSAFSADLSPTGLTTLPPGNTMLTFISTTVSGAITAGTYAGQLVLVGTENGNAFSRTQATENVIVDDAPDIQILADTPSQSPITADQAKSLKVRMVVKNNGGAAVTFTDASIKFIQAGQDRSGQFNISTPTGFTLGGSTLNGGGAADTVTFNVSDNTGNAMTVGMMTIQGFLEVEDVNTNQPILASRELGDFLQVQSPAAISVIAVLPSLTTVTAGMGRDFIVRALVQNTGTSDLTLNLTEPFTDASFSFPAGWVASPRTTLGNGGSVLTGGEIDTVLFNVTTSGTTTGNTTVSTAYTGTETNSGRVVTGGSSGTATINVQSPGNVTVTNVVASRATITNGAGVAWTLTVTLQNTGQSDVNLNLGNAIGVLFQNATAPPTLTKPSVLVGGGTVLSGGEIDQIVIAVGNSGTYSSPGLKNIDVSFTGTEINSNVARNGAGNTGVTVQLQPSLNVVSVTPTTVSRGSIVAFQVTIVNATTNGATATLNPLTTRLVFGSNAYNVNLDAGSPVDVAANQQITLLFNSAQVSPAIPTGVQADAQLRFRFVENDTPRSEDEPMNTPPLRQISVQNAPALSILSVHPSWQNATVGQANPGAITMVVRNSNGAGVDLDLSSAITRLQLNLLGSGSNVTNEYTIPQPTALVGGGEILASGQTDSLVFNVTQAGSTAGNVIVSGFVGGVDLNSQLPVSDNTADGGSGNFVLQTAGVLNIVKITPQRPTATIGQTGGGAGYTIKMAVRNDGQAAINLDLAAPTTTALDFGATPGWITNLQTSLVGGGFTLSGGETDTVVFDITRTGNTPGSQLIFGSVTGAEINRNVVVSDDASSGGWGTIMLQSQAALDILSVTPSPTSLTSGANVPWDITVVVRNTGESAARLILPTGLTMTIQSAPGATFDPVNFLEGGGVVLAGGDTGTLVVHGDTSPTFSAFGTRTIGVSLSALELNSNRGFVQSETIGSVVAQSDPNLTVALVPNPTPVTQGGQAFLQLDITNPGANAATVDLDGGNTRVSFAGGLYSAVLQQVSPTTVGPNQTVRVSFENKLVDPAITVGQYNVSVNLAYTANGLGATESETVTNGVNVLAPSSFRITGIAASQPSATAGQTTPWTATMTIVNEGAAPIDLNLAQNKTYLQFVAPGGGNDPGYSVTQPIALAGGGTQLGAGLTDQLVFTITQTGTTTGIIVISGRVEGTVGASTIVSDDTFDGGRGSIAVVSAAAVTVLATHTTQPRVTSSQTTDWDVHVIVANTGGAAVNLNLATSNIAFNGGTGWVVDPAQFLGSGNPLAGGGVDSLLFRVTTTSGNAGTRRIDATIPWQDVNNPTTTGTANTTTAGFGSIVVQTPVNLRISTTTSQSPNPAAVDIGQSFAVRVQVENVGAGHADARDVALVLNTSGGSAVTPIPPITQVASGETVTRDFAVDAAGAPSASETFTSAINSVTDANSGQPATPQSPLDDNAALAIQLPATLAIQNVRPSQSTVTRGQTADWMVIARVHNSGQAGAVLTPPSAGDLSFSIGGSNQTDYVVQPPTAFGSGAAGWTLAGNQTDSLIYVVSVTGAGTGVLDIGVSSDATDRNDPTLNVSDVRGTSVQVQAPAGLAIATTLPFGTVNHASADRDTVNTSFAYEIHITVDNTGGEAVDSVLVGLASDLSPGTRSTIVGSQRRQQIGIAGSHTFIYKITAPVNPVTLETFTSTILAGAKSHNTGLPVTPQPPADNRHVVVTQRPANLLIDLTSASGSVSTGQVFTMSATVIRTGTGQANVSGTAQMTLALPGGFALQNPGAEPFVRDFVVGTPVTWNVIAPGAPQAANLTTTISTTPNDNNTGAAALVASASDNFGMLVVAGGAFTNATASISAPAGAIDNIVSVGQGFTLQSSVTANATIDTVYARLSLPAGFSVLGPSVQNLGVATGGTKSANFSLIAPAGAATAANVIVRFTGKDKNTQQPVPDAPATVAVTTVARAALTASASVTAPPEATDNKVTIGTTFTVTASVANAPLAAGIASPGALSIGLPTGYTLANGTVSQPFTIGASVLWNVNAPPQPSGPDQINVTISTTPPDENSGQPALVVGGTASIAMSTEGSAVSVRDVSQNLGINVGPVPAGASNIRLLGFEIAYNVSDASVNDARIDTIAVTIVGDDGTALGPATVAATLSRLSIDLGGATPYEVVDPSTNPVVVALSGSGTDRLIAPDATRNAIVSVSLDANPSAKEISVGLRSGGLAVHDAVSNQRLGVTDSQGRPLDGVITSDPLVVLSSNFEEYTHNYPNPFRAGAQATRIAYFLQSPTDVSVSIYAIDGDLVYEEKIPSSDARAQAGPQETTWDGRNGQGDVVRNGVYVCVVNAGGKTAKFRIAVAK